MNKTTSDGLIALDELPNELLDFNDWGILGDGNWHFYEGNEMTGHYRIASVAPSPGKIPHFNEHESKWEWKINNE